MWWLGLIQAGMGIYQMIRNQSEQAKLAKEGTPKFGLTSNMKAATAQAEQQAKMGYSPQEKAAFMSNLSTSNNTAFRNGVDMAGGSMAGALKGAIKGQNLNALNEFARNDAALNRQNISNRNALYGAEQGLDNQNVSMRNNLLLRRAQSLGQQGQSGMNNIFGGIGGMMGGGGQGGGIYSMFGKNQTQTPAPQEGVSSWGIPRSSWNAAVDYAQTKPPMGGMVGDGYSNYYDPYFTNLYGNGKVGGLYPSYNGR